MTEDSENKPNITEAGTVAVKVSKETYAELVDLQHRIRKETGKKPTYQELMDAAWRAYSKEPSHSGESGVDSQPNPQQNTPIARDVLESTLQTFTRIRGHLRQAMNEMEAVEKSIGRAESGRPTGNAPSPRRAGTQGTGTVRGENPGIEREIEEALGSSDALTGGDSDRKKRPKTGTD